MSANVRCLLNFRVGRKSITRFFLFFLIFLYLVPVQIEVGGHIFAPLLQLMAPSLIVLFFGHVFLNSGRVPKVLFFLFIFLGFLLSFSSYSLFLSGFNDFWYQKELILGLILLVSSFSLAAIYFHNFKEEAATFLINDIAYVLALNAIVMIGVFFFDGFSEFLYQYIVIDPKQERSVTLGFRNSGLYYTGFSKLSLVYALVFCIKASLIFLEKASVRFIDFFVFVFLFVGIVLTGRTGVLILFFGVAGLFFCLLDGSGAKSPFRFLKFFFLFFVFWFLIFIFLYLSGYDYYLNWFFEFFVNYVETGVASTRSTNAVLTEHYFFPDSINSFLFGEGNFGRSSNLPYIPSDVGYVLFVHGVGLVGLLFSMLFFLLLFILSFRRSVPIHLKYSVGFCVFSILIGNLKDYYFMSHIGYSQVLFLIFFVAFFVWKGQGNFKRIERVYD